MLPERVELLMVAVPLLNRAPPLFAVLFEKFKPLTVRKELTSKLRIPAPLLVVLKLPVKTESVIVRLELVLMMPPPPLVALLPEMVELEMEMVPPLKLLMPPPKPAVVLFDMMEFLTIREVP